MFRGFLTNRCIVFVCVFVLSKFLFILSKSHDYSVDLVQLQLIRVHLSLIYMILFFYSGTACSCLLSKLHFSSDVLTFFHSTSWFIIYCSCLLSKLHFSSDVLTFFHSTSWFIIYVKVCLNLHKGIQACMCVGGGCLWVCLASVSLCVCICQSRDSKFFLSLRTKI